VCVCVCVHRERERERDRERSMKPQNRWRRRSLLMRDNTITLMGSEA